MTTVLKITTLLLFASCTGDKNFSKSKEPIEIAKDSLQTAKTISANHSFDTTMVINKQTFIIQTRDINDEFILLSFNSKPLDTLYSSGLAGIEFIDLNKDRLSDILISYIGNNPTHELYLFNLEANGFRYVEGFIKYPDAVQLKSYPEYYYSYHRAGCADLNWVSDLFKIEDFKTIHIGHLYGQGCDKPLDIKIYKILAGDENNKNLVEVLPHSKIEKYENHKWGFIEDYWNNNWIKFK